MKTVLLCGGGEDLGKSSEIQFLSPPFQWRKGQTS